MKIALCGHPAGRAENKQMAPRGTKDAGSVKTDGEAQIAASHGAFKAAVSVQREDEFSAVDGAEQAYQRVYAESFALLPQLIGAEGEQALCLQSAGIYQSYITGIMTFYFEHMNQLLIYYGEKISREDYTSLHGGLQVLLYKISVFIKKGPPERQSGSPFGRW